MRIINVHDKDEPRAGDIYSGPHQYFDWPYPIEAVSCRDLKKIPFEDADLIIFGGGGMLHIPFPEHDEGRFLLMEHFHGYANKVVLWGIGHNVHEVTKIEYPEYISDFLAVGVRDIGCGLRWVPCASCMHDAFLKDYDVVDDVRAFRRDDPFDWWPFPFEQYPMMKDARGHTLDEIVAFLGGAKTVVTNTYHGAYWSMLLGKDVVIYKPFSSKFYGMTGDYSANGNNIIIEPKNGFLSECVQANVSFFGTVLKEIEGIIK